MAVQLDRRLTVCGLFVAVVLAILAKLFYIQILTPDYKLSADNNVLRRITQYPARGIVYDRRGELVVYNEAAYDLMVIPSQVQAFDTAEFIALLGITHEQLVTSLKSAKAYSRYKESLFLKQMSSADFGRLQEHLYKFPGFFAQPRTLRHYPKPVAAHLLGYVGEVDERTTFKNPYYKPGDYIGISGLEKYYEEQLRGRRGVKNYLVDVHNRIKGSYAGGQYDTIAQAGANLHLSLDLTLQMYGEQLMQGRIGSIVALDPRNGEILAMVSSPTYDPNLLVGRQRSQNFLALNADALKPLFNRPIMALYPPGSTFKVVNGLIGLQEQVVYPGTGYQCLGRYPVGRGVGCHIHPYASNLSAAVRMSCNTYFCHVFRHTLDNPKYANIEEAYEAWSKRVHQIGFGQRLQVDLPGELNGIVPTTQFYNKFFRKGGWNSLTLISLSIGQGELGTTPLQMANLAATIGNRGYYYTPHLVRYLAGQDTVWTTPERHSTGIDSSLYAPIVEGMYQAVNADFSLGPTGWRARVPGHDVCGKTGTAQNPHGEDHSVFIAFAPRDEPRIAIAVYVENAGFGGRWAAPIAGLMIEQYLNDSVSNKAMEAYVLNVAPALPPARSTPLVPRKDSVPTAMTQRDSAALQ